ncbi:MAG: LPXTG cell wall anchor domain-containing protein [Acidimicrobiia bacterium]
MLLVTAFAGLASAQTVDGFELTIPLDTVAYIPYDSHRVLATEPVPAQFAGQSCEVIGISHNQDSVHPDNDLWVESGTSMVILHNVEDEPGGTVEAAGTLVLGSEVTVTLHMGPDGIFSAGLDVVVDCAGQATTTTIAATTTSTIAATTTTTIAGTTITAPPEVTTSTVADEVLGTVVTSSTVADEVEAVEVLPLTGSTDGGWLFLAGSLLALGGILVVGSRREEG